MGLVAVAGGRRRDVTVWSHPAKPVAEPAEDHWLAPAEA
jgi:hypothetical protein